MLRLIPLLYAFVFWRPENWLLLRVTNFKKKSKMLQMLTLANEFLKTNYTSWILNLDSNITGKICQHILLMMSSKGTKIAFSMELFSKIGQQQ